MYIGKRSAKKAKKKRNRTPNTKDENVTKKPATVVVASPAPAPVVVAAAASPAPASVVVAAPAAGVTAKPKKKTKSNISSTSADNKNNEARTQLYKPIVNSKKLREKRFDETDDHRKKARDSLLQRMRQVTPDDSSYVTSNYDVDMDSSDDESLTEKINQVELDLKGAIGKGLLEFGYLSDDSDEDLFTSAGL